MSDFDGASVVFLTQDSLHLLALSGETSLSLIGAIGCLVFASSAYSMALLEKWLFQEPMVWIVALGVELVILNRIMVYRNRSFTNGLGVQYEDKPLPTVQTLDLNA